MSNSRNLIIFEESSHAEKISEYRGSNESFIVSFSVPGKLKLEKRGIKCSFPDELMDLPNLNQMGMDNIERVQKICNFLDKKLQEKFVFLKENKMNLFSAGYYNVKIFFDVLYSSYFILEELFNKANAKEIIIFKRKYSLDKVAKGQNPIVPALVENVFLKQYSNIRIVSNDKFDFKNLSLSGLKSSIKNIYSFFLKKKNKKKKYTYNGVVLHNSHDIPYLIDEILNDINFYELTHLRCKPVGVGFIRPAGLINFATIPHTNFSRNMRRELTPWRLLTATQAPTIGNSIKETFREALNSKPYREMFIGDDNLFYFANQCLESYLLRTIGNLLPYADYIKKWLTNLAPRLLLTASCRLDLTDAFLLELVRSLKIPIVTYQEGGGSGYLNWPLFNLDTELSDYFLVYGNGVKESPFINGKAKVVPVGSIRLAKIKRELNIEPPPQITIYIILDIFKMGTWQHYPWNGGFFSQAYSHQFKILNILKEFKPIKFVLKTIKGREFLYELFIDQGFIQIVTEPLTGVLDNASAFILDWPSTVLQECLLTDKPIALLYDSGCVKFEDNALKSLSKRVRISSNPEQFYEVINSLIGDVKYGTEMTRQDEFLKNYCLMENTSGNLENFFSRLLNSDSY